MLKDLWKDQDLTFGIASLLDRKPLTEDDSLVVIAAPDPQGADETIRVSNSVGEEKAVVLFNPRLASGDVGVGLNVRRLRENFLKVRPDTMSLPFPPYMYVVHKSKHTPLCDIYTYTYTCRTLW